MATGSGRRVHKPCQDVKYLRLDVDQFGMLERIKLRSVANEYTSIGKNDVFNLTEEEVAVGR